MRKIAGYLTKNRSEKDQKIAQSTHENGYIKPRKTFWRNSKQLLNYSRTKLVCEKWIGTQRHKGTEFYFFERTEFTVQSAGFMIFAFSI